MHGRREIDTRTRDENAINLSCLGARAGGKVMFRQWAIQAQVLYLYIDPARLMVEPHSLSFYSLNILVSSPS